MSEKASDVPSQSEDAQIEIVLQMIQDSLNQPEVNVAAPAQEILQAANSDAATEALASHTLSIFVDKEDDDTTEVTSILCRLLVFTSQSLNQSEILHQ